MVRSTTTYTLFDDCMLSTVPSSLVISGYALMECTVTATLSLAARSPTAAESLLPPMSTLQPASSTAAVAAASAHRTSVRSGPAASVSRARARALDHARA